MVNTLHSFLLASFSDISPSCIIAVAVSALVKRDDSSRIMDDLEKSGATDILLFAITNSRM